MALTPAQQAAADALVADFQKFMATFGAATPAPAAPTAPAGKSWWRNPGAPLGDKPATCYDDVATAQRYAAQGFNASGIRSVAASDLAAALTLADYLGDDKTTAQGAEGKLNGAGWTDMDSAIYQLLSGMTTGFPAGLGGAPRLMYEGRRLADLLHAPGTAVGGNVAG